MIKHIRRWNIWRKHCLNSKFHKFLVLFGKHSPTMMFTLLPNEQVNFTKIFNKLKSKED